MKRMLSLVLSLSALSATAQYYEIVATHSRKCVDVANLSNVHASPVVQADCWGGGNQKWKLTPSGDAYNLIVQHSQLCLDVAYASQSHAAPVVQGTCWNGDNQRWRLNKTGTLDGYSVYELRAVHSGKCLDIENASLAHAAPVVQGDCWGGANQRFILKPVAP